MTITNTEAVRRYRERFPERRRASNKRMRSKPGYQAYDNQRHKNRRRTRRGWAMATVYAARQRAKRKGIELTITYKDVLAVWPKFSLCPVLGIRLKIGNRIYGNRSPSLDRVKNNKGYLPNNIRVISNRANIIKNDASISELKQVIAYMESHQ